MSFHPGDTFMYVNVSDVMVQFRRDKGGVWHRYENGQLIEPGGFAPVDDAYMANHMHSLMIDKTTQLTWGFYTRGGNEV